MRCEIVTTYTPSSSSKTIKVSTKQISRHISSKLITDTTTHQDKQPYLTITIICKDNIEIKYRISSNDQAFKLYFEIYRLGKPTINSYSINLKRI